MELVRVLSNTEAGSHFDRLAGVLAPLKAKAARHKVVLGMGPPRQGDVMDAMKAVLIGCTKGLPPIDVLRLVERRLGRSVPPSTVRDNLHSNASFERVVPGRYRLRSARP